MCALVLPTSRADADGWLAALRGSHQRIAVAESADVPESSGLALSTRNDVIYWTHNDSGGYPTRVYAFRLSAADRRAGRAPHVGYVELTGVKLRDWEDLAAGPDHNLYLLDGGDSPPCRRSDKQVLRFTEPPVDPDGRPVAIRTRPEIVRFEYPDSKDPRSAARRDSDRYDAECLIVDPAGGDMYIVTKRGSDGTPVARVYRLPAAGLAWGQQRAQVLEYVCDLGDRVSHMVTGGAARRDGQKIAVRNYLAAYEFIVPPGGRFADAFRQQPRRHSLLGEPQGEAIAYNARGDELITTTEVLSFGLKNFVIYATPIGESATTATATAPE